MIDLICLRKYLLDHQDLRLDNNAASGRVNLVFNSVND